MELNIDVMPNQHIYDYKEHWTGKYLDVTNKSRKIYARTFYQALTTDMQNVYFDASTWGIAGIFSIDAIAHDEHANFVIPLGYTYINADANVFSYFTVYYEKTNQRFVLKSAWGDYALVHVQYVKD